MATRIRIFLDTSAILAGIWSARGGGRMLLRLGEAGAIQPITSRLAIQELESLLRERAPEELGALALLLDRADVVVAGEASGETLERAHVLVNHPANARILGSAMEAEIEFFATLDREHVVDNQRLAGQATFRIGTPGECLEWLRRRFQRLARSSRG